MESSTRRAERNLRSYEAIALLRSGVLFWAVMTLIFTAKGLSFTQIALLQTFGSAVTIGLEVPLGFLSDKKGYRPVLVLAALAFFSAAAVLFVASSFPLLMVSEALFALARSAQSGADTALLWQSLRVLGRQEEYTALRAKIFGRGAVISFLARLVAPVLFAWALNLPVGLSLLLYAGMVFFAFGYRDFDDLPGEEIEKDLAHEPEGAVKRFFSGVWAGLRAYRRFLLLAVIGAVTLVLVSNYYQFLGPFLEERHFNVAWMGVVLSLSSLGDWLGAKAAVWFKKRGLVFGLTAAFLGLCATLAGSTVSRHWLAPAAAYGLIAFFHLPFSLLLSEALNQAVPDRLRATLLSTANQIDEFFALLADPLIGLGLDRLGFNVTYRLMTLCGVGLLVLFLLPRAGRRGGEE